MTPSNVSPVVTKRQSAMSSLRARATIIVLRVRTVIGSAGLVPQCRCAVLLKQQKTPGKLDHAAADTRRFPLWRALVPAAWSFHAAELNAVFARWGGSRDN